MAQELAEMTRTQDQLLELEQEFRFDRGSSCTAPNRDTCSVHCPSGNCYAIYHEPDGPCKAGCMESAGDDLLLSSLFSIQISVTNASLLAHAMADQIPDDLQRMLEASDEPLTVAGIFTLEQFVDELYRQLSGSAKGETEA